MSQTRPLAEYGGSDPRCRPKCWRYFHSAALPLSPAPRAGLGPAAERSPWRARWLQSFQRSGHGDSINSGIGPRQNQPVRPDQLHQALGPRTVENLSRLTGVAALAQRRSARAVTRNRWSSGWRFAGETERLRLCQRRWTSDPRGCSVPSTRTYGGSTRAASRSPATDIPAAATTPIASSAAACRTGRSLTRRNPMKVSSSGPVGGFLPDP
jgi:hypothetical protein